MKETLSQTEQVENSEALIAAALEYRFGDGLVSLPRRQLNKLNDIAQKRGFVDKEGYLTRKGRALLARYH